MSSTPDYPYQRFEVGFSLTEEELDLVLAYAREEGFAGQAVAPDAAIRFLFGLQLEEARKTMGRPRPPADGEARP